MTLEQLLEATDGHAPGYTGAARDCLLEAALTLGTDNSDMWIATAQVFATLAVADAINGVANVVDNIDALIRHRGI